jgi:hypothetical protein
MDRYNLFVSAMQQSNQHITIAFFAALGIVAGYYSLDWLPKNWAGKLRPFYLAWWLVIFTMVFLFKFG